ncbi:S-layer protein [Kurthia senegalensis]|uniref:S-layer protein n=1 Tax=Kurthia senegalensis TaxID=1033740 RepID=UPI0002890035|nr:S-layer protein [Kurthia senegalensis]
MDIQFYDDEKPATGFYINAASNYILDTVTNPQVGSTSGEWSVMDLARGGYTGFDYVNRLNESDFNETYLSNLYAYIESKAGVLSTTKSTEYSRVTLALSALNEQANPVGDTGLSIVDHLNTSFAFSKKQGINGPIWELIALNTKDYNFSNETGEGDWNTKGKMLDFILNAEIEGGGWSLFGAADPDITGMALQALAPYYNHLSKYEETGATVTYKEFMTKIDRAVQKLATMQGENGGYTAWGNTNAESTAQVIVALTALGQDPTATQLSLPTLGTHVAFNDGVGTQDGVTTTNTIEAILSFYAAGSGQAVNSAGFRHVTTGYDGGGGSGVGVNAMATDQVLYALIAYDRYQKGENTLYDMTDAQSTYTAKSYTVTYVFKDGTTKQVSYAPYAAVDLLDTAAAWETAAKTSYASTETLAMPEKNITLYEK